MPLDAVCLRAVVEELRPQLLGLRIDKVQQPCPGPGDPAAAGKTRLLLNAGANAPRIQLTELLQGQPGGAPHVLHAAAQASGWADGWQQSDPAAAGAAGAARAGRSRTTFEFGRESRRTLVLEAMGRRSNLILLDGEGRIIDCLRRVDA